MGNEFKCRSMQKAQEVIFWSKIKESATPSLVLNNSNVSQCKSQNT